MDLSLSGSQINLALRKKPNVANARAAAGLQRPGSAILQRLPRNSPILRRPLSADNNQLRKSLNNCVRFSENILCENKIRQKNKYGTNSSAELLNLLLKEPIKRRWTNQENDTSSESSLGQKICNISNRQSRKMESSDEISIEEDVKEDPTEKVDDEVEETEIPQIILDPSEKGDEDHQTPNQELPSDINSDVINTDQQMNNISDKLKPLSKDFWQDKKSSDLPGRVSFSKNDIYEEDVSDCENNAEQDPPMQTSTRPSSSSSSACKKSVHFKDTNGIAIDAKDSKCTFEGCPCGKAKLSCSISLNHEIKDNQNCNCFCSFTCSSSSYLKIENNAIRMQSARIDMKSDDEQQLKTDAKDFMKKYDECFEENGNHDDECRGISFSKYIPAKLTEHLNANYKNYHEKETYLLENNIKENEKEFSNIVNFNTIKSQKEAEKKIIFDESMYEKNASHQNLSRSSCGSKDSIPKYFHAYSNKNDNSKKRNNNFNIKTTTKSQRSTKSVPFEDNRRGVGLRNKKPAESPFICGHGDSKLDEFHMDKVDSWMSLHDSTPPSTTNSPEMTTTKDIDRISVHSAGSPETIERTKTPDSSNDDSTYDEIVSVIKEIEAEKQREEEANDSKSDISFKLKALLGSNSPDYQSPDTERTDKDESAHKFKDILNYLDDVETNCERTLIETRRSIPESTRSEIEFSIEPDIAEDVPKIADLLMLPNHQLARRIVALSLRSNELSNAIQLSKEHVSHVRSERQKSIRQEKQNTTNRLREQKKHYETIVSRHQTFIEQLLKDKSSLCEKVTALTRRIESQNQAWEHKIQTEVARVKEATLAGEKIRRERWVRDNTKKIKELTVKGLELEINKMNCEHLRDMNELKRLHQQELLDASEEARLKFEEAEKAIRESCAKDRELNIAKERNAIRERFERQMQEEQQLFDDQKKKLMEELNLERDRLYSEMKQKDGDLEQQRNIYIQEKDNTVQRIYNDFRDKLQQQEQKYELKISSLEQQFESDFLVWKREYENSCKLREVENENAIRQHYRAERDRQIDAIVCKMDSESIKCQEEFELKINRLKAKHENDLRELELTEKSLKQKCNDLRNRLAESDGRALNLEADNKQMRIELDHCKKMCDEFLAEKEEMKENARKEIQSEINAMQTNRDNEIQQIYKRVQQAIEKKDASMELLQQENAALRERNMKLEAIIRQQRKDYCIK